MYFRIEFKRVLLVVGAIYNADFQCRLQFNVTDYNVTVCEDDKICQELWCYTEEGCISKQVPAASGTNCDKHKVVVHEHKSQSCTKILIYFFKCSGVRIRSACPSKISQHRSMAVGAIGTNGRNVHEIVEAELSYRLDSATIRRLPMADRFALENAFATRCATRISFVRKGRPPSESNSARHLTGSRLKGNTTNGFRTRLVVSF